MPNGCVIFDFDGVIADTEALHLAAYNRALAGHASEIGGGLEISRAVYFSRYIVFGDREAIFHVLRDQGRAADAGLVERIAETKHRLFEERLRDFADPLPGVREVLEWLEGKHVPRAICSGARLGEIEHLLDGFGLRHHFDVIVAIEDVRNGKPDPEGYNLAFERLNLEYDAELDKGKSLVIEDSAGGCYAAKAAGLRVLGVGNSLPMEELGKCATFVVEGLDKLERGLLASWLGLVH